jgi:hypothetical protein
LASYNEQFQSSENPFADLPYAIEKLTVFAFFLYEAYFTFKSGAGASPFDLSHSNNSFPS